MSTDAGQQETDLVRVSAGGVVRAELIDHEQSGEIEIAITIKDHWHINSDKPLDDYLIPTSVTIEGAKDTETVYPEPVVKNLEFNGAPLALFEGSFSLRSKKPKDNGGGRTEILLTVQACDDDVCLPPEDIRFLLE